jgi:hypothetical protein
MQSKISIMQFVKIINWELREVHCPAALNRPSQVADDLHPIWHTAPSCCTHTTPMEARDRQDVAYCTSFFVVLWSPLYMLDTIAFPFPCVTCAVWEKQLGGDDHERVK